MKQKRKKEWEAVKELSTKKRKPQQIQLKVTDRVPVQSHSHASLDVPKIGAKGIALGLLPINFSENPGFLIS